MFVNSAHITDQVYVVCVNNVHVTDHVRVFVCVNCTYISTVGYSQEGIAEAIKTRDTTRPVSVVVDLTFSHNYAIQHHCRTSVGDLVLFLMATNCHMTRKVASLLMQ